MSAEASGHAQWNSSPATGKVEDKLACLIDQMQDSRASTITTPKEVGCANTSYAETASVHLPVNQVPPIHLKSTSRALDTDSRASKVVLFGLPEGKSIIESKGIVDEVFEYLAGRPVVMNDIFHLGKYSQQSPRPRPLLVKLSAIWDKNSFSHVREISATLRSNISFSGKMFHLIIIFVEDFYQEKRSPLIRSIHLFPSPRR